MQKSDVHIMLVDDDPKFLKEAQSFLQEEEYHVSSFSTAKKATQALKATDFHIVIVDNMLPDQNGLEMIHSLLDNHHPQNTLFILTSGIFKNKIYIRSVMQKRVCASYFIKSADTKKLVPAVNEVIQKNIQINPSALFQLLTTKKN